MAVLALAGVACGDRAIPENVLLISIDSLRADHLGGYGYARATSPTLDRLAADGVRFDNALSPTSWTLPAHVTLLSGLAQRHHGTLTPADRIASGTELLAEVFARQGWETVGFFSGPFLHPAYGFARGFGEYVSCRPESEGPARRSASKLPGATALDPETRATFDAWRASLARTHSDVTNPWIKSAFEAWLAGRSQRPFFAFLHMWDVHYDYAPPEPYASMFATDYTGPLDGRKIEGKGFPLSASAADVAHLVALYDGEVRYVDDTIGDLLGMLDAAGVLNRTLVVVTSDHGDEFLEHGGKGHQRTLYDEVVRVPLIFWGPGSPRGRVVTSPVSLEDVAPTILRLTGIEGLEGADGRDLLPLMRDRERASRSVFGAFFWPVHPKLTSVRSGDAKLIYEVREDRFTQFDLKADPEERHPQPPDEDLRRALLAYTAQVKRAVEGRPEAEAGRLPADFPPEVAEQLQRLGYIE